ncbi:MAG: cell wall hydrolase [Lachnospiraceae bacterium]|nr:cell wall hydrolase [Lachnospiraceae bacterium]
MLADSYYDDIAAEEWSESLLASSTYGAAISYSSGWYNSLSTVELLARCIYCEGGTAYTTEGNAVAWVILNRVHNSSFPNAPLGVITASGQFASVTRSSSETSSARTPSTSSSRWQNATYLACLMLTTTDTTEWKALVGNTINGQLYFYSYTIAKNNGGSPFSGTSSSSLYYNSTRITNVYVLGYGSVSSFTTLFADYSPTVYSRNIYYDYY